MKTTYLAGSLGVAAVMLLGACGGGGGSIAPAKLDPVTQSCNDALVTRGVATQSMLDSAAYATLPAAGGVQVVFSNGYPTGDPLYHVFGSCLIEGGVITRVGQ